jgi:hypothetical protein
MGKAPQKVVFHFEHPQGEFLFIALSVTVQVQRKFKRYARERLPLIRCFA